MSLVGRVWKTSSDGKIEWITLGEAHMEGALSLITESFIKAEPVSIVTSLALRPNAVRQVEHLCTLIAQDGASIVAVEKATSKVVGVAFNKISNKNKDSSFLENLRQQSGIDEGYAEFLNFFSRVEAKVNVFEHYKVDTVLDHMLLGTHQEWHNQGIGLGLISATVALAKALKSIQAVIAIFTGPISQRLGKKLGWDVLAEVSYDSMSHKGEKYSDKLEPNVTKCVFMAIMLSN